MKGFSRMQPKFVLTLVISWLMISLTGSIILLFATPQSYILFFLFFLLTTLVMITIMGKSIVFKIPHRGKYIDLNIFLIIASIALVILQLTDFQIASLNAILYVIVLIFAFGFFILSILKFKPSLSRIEYVALAYPLSVALLAIIGTITLFLPANLRGISTLITVTFLSAISLFVVRKEKQTKVNNNNEIIIKNNEIILFITLILFVVFLAGLYPKVSSFPGLDISRNFLYALSFTKDTLGNLYYLNAGSPLFSTYQSSIIYIVKPSVEIFAVTTVSFAILGILTFYAMASQYLKRYGDYIPAIATLIWSTFSGFGFLNFISNKINSPNVPLLSLIGQADAFSYGDITWRRLFFYLSMEVAFTLVFALLYFLKRTELSKTKLVLLMTLLITPIPLMHQYAVYLLLPVLLCFVVICNQELKQQLKCVSYSLIIASFSSLGLNYVLNVKAPTIAINILSFSELLLTGLFLITITSLRRKTPRRPNIIIRKLTDYKYAPILVTFLMLLCFSCLLIWVSGDITFNFGNLDNFGYVPTLLYPVKLGISGVLAIVAIYILFTNSRFRSKELIAFFASVLLLIFVSRLISTIQMQYVSEFTFNPNSWLSEIIRQNILSFREERMFELFKIPMAILASIVLSKSVLTRINLKKASLSKYIVISGLVSLVLFSGMASTFLGFEYYVNQTQANPLSSSESNIISAMQNNIYTNGKATIISPQTPPSYLDFTGATTIITEATAAWESKSPELPLFVTRYSPTTPTYIYLNKIGDYQKLNDYTGNYLAHIANVTPTYLENGEVQIKGVNDTSIPVPNSATSLIIPYDTSTMSTVKPFLQEESKQYMVASLLFGHNMQSQNFYKEPINYTNVQIDGTANFNGLNSTIRINGSQTNFNKIQVEFEFQTLDIANNRVFASKFDWGNPSQRSWEIAQYGKQIIFKVSPDGEKEIVLSTPEVLQVNDTYTVKCQYDGTTMQISVNNRVLAEQSYTGGIFSNNADIIIGAELHNDNPTAFAEMSLNYIRILNNIPHEKEIFFYAYDLLSSMGFNYTTTLSSGSDVGKYKTLVLPYDDTITQEILNQIETKPTESSTRYVAIINANGYGPLLDVFGKKTSETLQVDRIFNDENHMIQAYVEVPKITLNNETKVEAQYVNGSFSSPFVMTTKQGQLTLIYVNIYPLISQNRMLDPAFTQPLTKVLSKYIELYDERNITPWFTEPSLLFTGFKANGTISIRSDSVASIELPEGRTIDSGSLNSILINSTEISVQGGYGFFTAITTYNPFVTIQGNQTISINVNGKATFLIKQPEISIDGETKFENLRMFHPPTIYTDGRNITLSGKMTLNVYLSEQYTIILPYKLNSPIAVKYDIPLMQFDETASILQLVPYCILILIFAIAAALLHYSRSIDPKTEPGEANE
jgi:hypothetical protein